MEKRSTKKILRDISQPFGIGYSESSKVKAGFFASARIQELKPSNDERNPNHHPHFIVANTPNLMQDVRKRKRQKRLAYFRKTG